MRIQANSNFIFNCFNRVHQHDIDLTFAEGKELSRLATLGNPGPKTSMNNSSISSGSNNKDKSWDLLGSDQPDSSLPAAEEGFEWLHEQAEIDEHELNSKIEQVMQSMSRKEEERGEDRESEEEEENFDDYLDKLVSET
jgi:hypothetical protein